MPGELLKGKKRNEKRKKEKGGNSYLSCTEPNHSMEKRDLASSEFGKFTWPEGRFKLLLGAS